MIYLAERPFFRIATLCGLYVSQGIPFGFVTITLAAYLSERGAGVDEIGFLLSVTTLPWSFKWVWGPLIDQYGFPLMGRRRPWILLAQTMMSVTIAAMIFIPDLSNGFYVLCGMVLVHNIFGSLQDVSTDALAVDLLREDERGKANGLMYGSSYLGTLLGGAGLGVVVGVFGLRAGLIVQICTLLAIMCVPLMVRERRGDQFLSLTPGSGAPDSDQSILDLFVALGRAFSLRSTLLGAAVALLVKIGVGVLTAVTVVHFIQNYNWTQAEYSEIAGGWAVGFGLFGSFAGGFIADLVKPKRLAMIASVLLGLLWIGFGGSIELWPNKSFVIAYFCIQDLLTAVLSVSLFALFMGISWPVVAATQFTAYMALLNLSNTIGTWFAGKIEMPVDQMFLAAGAFQIALIGVIVLIDPHQTRRLLGGSDDSGAGGGGDEVEVDNAGVQVSDEGNPYQTFER